jgi:hypothetical protein
VSVPARLASFAVVLVVVFGAAFGLGTAVGPIDPAPAGASQQERHSPDGAAGDPSHDSGSDHGSGSSSDHGGSGDSGSGDGSSGGG